MSSDSDTHEVLARRGWYLLVGSLVTATTATFLNIRRLKTISPADSWEYVASLSYEWNVIRGYQRYRWTIWVLGVSLL